MLKEFLIFKIGLSTELTLDIEKKVQHNREGINKFDMVRTILTRLNDKGEKTLKERREILKRITEWEDFSACWPKDRLPASGLVSEIRKVVNAKDTITRINNERKKERQGRIAQQNAIIKKKKEKQEKLSSICKELSELFAEQDARKRGKTLEGVLNRMFEACGMLVREAFTLKGTEGEGIIEQIDGVVEIDSSLYFVEMKWWNKPIGKAEVSQHLINIYNRGHANGIFISALGYTQPAITICKESLQRMVVILCTLQEIIFALEKEHDILAMMQAKIRAAVIDKNPLHDWVPPKSDPVY